MFKKLSLLILGLFVLGILSPVSSFAQSDMKITRIQGKDRYKTAVELSKAVFVQSDYVVLASGENYPDALVGGTLANEMDSPILLTPKKGLTTEVLSELKRLDVETVILLGGEKAVSPYVERHLKKEFKHVLRVAGKDRYETARRINEERYEWSHMVKGLTHYTADDFVSYTSGTNFPDALAAAPFVSQRRAEDGAQNYLRLASKGQDVTPYEAIGGTSVVKRNDRIQPEYGVKRIAGKNRYSTAVEIAKRYKIDLNKNIDTIVLANGENYPDALSASPLVVNLNAALLLTKPGSLPTETSKYIKDNKIKNIIIVGGEKSVSNTVVRQLLK